MSPTPESDKRFQPENGDAYLRNQLASIDGGMFNGMPADDRFESGVPDGQRASSLDFIQMSGLTRPPIPQDAEFVDSPAHTPLYTDLNPTGPLSFYERGVADVDDVMGASHHGDLSDASLDANLVPENASAPLRQPELDSQSVQAFREIVAGLQRGETKAHVELDEETSPYHTPDTDHDAGLEGSTSTALLSMLEELETVMRASSLSDPKPEDGAEARDAALDSEGEADDIDESFDALIGALDAPDVAVANANTEPVRADADTSTDDWDALLDSVTRAPAPPEPEAQPEAPAGGTTPAPAAIMPAARVHTGKGALAEAEQLMQALERKPAANPEVAHAPSAPPAAPTAAEHAIESPLERELGPQAEAEAHPVYDYSAAPVRRRSRRHSRVARRGWRIIKTGLAVGLLCGSLAVLWHFVAAPALVKSEDLRERANRLMEAGDYTGASKAFAQLAGHRAPGDSERADAEFRAAYALTLGPEHSMDDTRRRYESALAKFQEFVDTYPQHAKRARALSIMGRLHFELQNFEQAITVLRDQVKPAEDPPAALAMLRYLARAYSMTGRYDEAETSYLQAATLPGNYSADADYLELGDLFRRRAGLAEDGAQRDALKETAVSYWRRALQVPGLAPSDRSALEERLQWLSFTEQAGDDVPAPESGIPEAEAAEAPMETPAPEAPAESPVESPDVGIPVPADEAGRAEVPGAELEVLVAPADNAPVAPAGS